ncbi:NAD(P)-dependent oxidoreductase [Leucobacter sp. CX87]|uniref:NAD(P)-dependent oxidoreductase n=1 Tax=unclassified Leucobacter TaxID=2621730 RepID=UPI00333F69F7
MSNPAAAPISPTDLRVPGPAAGAAEPRSAAGGGTNRLGSAEVPVRCYEPAGDAWATLVWAHGGSFVRGTLDWPEADWVSRRFAEAGIRVYSVDYVLAGPQVSAPAPARDVAAVLAWALARHDAPVFVGGASAGGNLAVQAALTCPGAAALLLLYPTLHRAQRPDPAIQALTAALPEARRFSPSRIAAIYADYLGEAPPADAIVVGEQGAERLSTLPPTIIVNAELDELRASGEQFAEQLRAAGVFVDLQLEPGTVHGYLNRPTESPAAARACADTIARFVTALRALRQDPAGAARPGAAAPRLVVALPGATLERAVGEIAGAEIVRWDLSTPPPRDRFDIVVPPYMDGPAVLRALAGVSVGLVQSQSIGFDGVADFLPDGMPFANAATVHETSTAELAIGLTLAMQRGLPDFVRAGDEGRWAPARHASLADRRVLLVGYGGVSRAIEARLAGFEVELTRVARTARTTHNDAGEEVPVHGIDELPALLAAAEIVIVAVPLSAETRGLFDAAALARLSDGALLVNVARGPVVDTGALVAELSRGRIRAALDVTDPEPLPAEHPLWGCPNLLVSPHVGGASTAMIPRMARLVRRQIGHLLAGETPENVVLGGQDPA